MLTGKDVFLLPQAWMAGVKAGVTALANVSIRTLAELTQCHAPLQITAFAQ